MDAPQHRLQLLEEEGGLATTFDLSKQDASQLCDTNKRPARAPVIDTRLGGLRHKDEARQVELPQGKQSEAAAFQLSVRGKNRSSAPLCVLEDACCRCCLSLKAARKVLRLVHGCACALDEKRGRAGKGRGRKKCGQRGFREARLGINNELKRFQLGTAFGHRYP